MFKYFTSFSKKRLTYKMKKDCSISYIKSAGELRNISILCRGCLFVLLLSISLSQVKAQSPNVITESIQLETDNIFDKLVEIRRDFHKYPEISGKEKRTQEVIRKRLLDLGLKVETDIYGYGIVGILEGKKEGKKLLGEPIWMLCRMILPIMLISSL